MKKNLLLNWVVILLALAPAGYLLWLWPLLPDTVPVHFGADMKPDRMGPKAELWIPVLILSVISLFVYFLFKNIHRIDPKRKDAAQAATFQKLGVGTAVFMAALNVLIIHSSQNGGTSPNLLFPLLGFMFAFLGNYMVHIKPNYFAGFRLPWTLSSDENWRKTHELGGKIWFAGGLAIAVISLFLPATAAFVFFLVAIVVMALIPIVYSYRLFKKQA